MWDNDSYYELRDIEKALKRIAKYLCLIAYVKLLENGLKKHAAKIKLEFDE